jgi:thiamine pyrophosphokinase
MINAHPLIDDTSYHSILCLNGQLPSREFFLGQKPIIAADGAANKLKEMQITPAIIVGDLDSVDKTLLTTSPFIQDKNQSSTDFEKCLAYLKNENLLPALIVGIDGGYLDHILHNINLFLATECIFYTPNMMGFTIKTNSQKKFSTQIGTKISLLGLPTAVVTTQGLKWELQENQLTFPGNTSCFNRALTQTLHVHVHQGNLLVLIYHDIISDAGWE